MSPILQFHYPTRHKYKVKQLYSETLINSFVSQPSLQFQSEIFDTLSESVVKDSNYLVFNLESISEYQDCKEVEQKSLVYMGCINQETGRKRTTNVRCQLKQFTIVPIKPPTVPIVTQPADHRLQKKLIQYVIFVVFQRILEPTWKAPQWKQFLRIVFSDFCVYIVYISKLFKILQIKVYTHML